jgi:hypothetical protein
MPGTRWNRKLRIVAAFLIAGAVVTVGVAWGCALWSTVTSVTVGRSRANSPAGLEPSLVPRGHVIVTGRGPGLIDVLTERRLVRAGWPWPALSVQLEGRGGQRPSTPRGALAKWARADYGPPSLGAWPEIEFVVAGRPPLPLRPEPLTFLLDTALYAGVVGCLVLATRVLVRVVRRRRGLCAQCGYSRHGLLDGVVCPECGEPSPA